MIMADPVVINLRLPETLSKKLSDASTKSGVPKNAIFNDAVTAAINGVDDEHYEKEEYIYTCVRLPSGVHEVVRSMAYGNYLTINAMLVQILAEHFGDKNSCHVAEDEK